MGVLLDDKPILLLQCRHRGRMIRQDSHAMTDTWASVIWPHRVSTQTTDTLSRTGLRQDHPRVAVKLGLAAALKVKETSE